MQRQSLTNSYQQISPEPKIINLANPNIKDTIPQLIQGIACCQSCQFVQLLTIFADKIDKLRLQRNQIKEKYVQDIYELQKKVRILQQQNQTLKTTIKSQASNPLKSAQLQSNRIFIQALQQEIGLEPSTTNSNKQPEQASVQIYENKQIEDTDTDTMNYIQQINKMAVKYNICGQELENMIKEYLEAQAVFQSNWKEKKKVRMLQEKLEREREQSYIRSKIQAQIKGKSLY